MNMEYVFNGIDLACVVSLVGVLAYACKRLLNRRNSITLGPQYWAAILCITRERFETNEEFNERVMQEASQFLKSAT